MEVLLLTSLRWQSGCNRRNDRIDSRVASKHDWSMLRRIKYRINSTVKMWRTLSLSEKQGAPGCKRA